jgi:hypothetical protein
MMSMLVKWIVQPHVHRCSSRRIKCREGREDISVRVLVGLGFASLNCSPSLSLLDYLDSKFVLLYKQPIEATINTR